MKSSGRSLSYKNSIPYNFKKELNKNKKKKKKKKR